jgi:hypothetical protein
VPSFPTDVATAQEYWAWVHPCLKRACSTSAELASVVRTFNPVRQKEKKVADAWYAAAKAMPMDERSTLAERRREVETWVDDNRMRLLKPKKKKK